MNSLRLHLLMVMATAVLFLGALALNELLFARLEFVRGVNWIYLPAGIRLLCTLLFGEAGAIGLLLVSWAVCFFYFFPDDVVRSFMGGILASAAPYLVYRIMQRHAGLEATLKNLTPVRLLWCATAFAIASPVLHHLWFAVSDPGRALFPSFVAMAIGDLTGSLLILYLAKMILALLPARR